MTIVEEGDVVEFSTSKEVMGTDRVTTNNEVVERNDTNDKEFREMKKLDCLFNPQGTKTIEDYNRGRDVSLEQVNMALFGTAFFKEPSTFKEAINHEKKDKQDAWKEAIN